MYRVLRWLVGIYDAVLSLDSETAWKYISLILPYFPLIKTHTLSATHLFIFLGDSFTQSSCQLEFHRDRCFVKKQTKHPYSFMT